MKTYLIAVSALLMAGGCIYSAIDRKLAEDTDVVAARVSACGDAYQQQYEAAKKRIGRQNGFCIVHEPDCTVRVERAKIDRL